jgi:hypothetical protein
MPDFRKSFVLAAVRGPPPRDLAARLAGPGLVQDRLGAATPTALYALNPATKDGVLLLHAPDGFPANLDRTRANLTRCLAVGVDARLAAAAEWLRDVFADADDLHRALKTDEPLDAFWRQAVDAAWTEQAPSADVKLVSARATRCSEHGLNLVDTCTLCGHGGRACRSYPRQTNPRAWAAQFVCEAVQRGCTELHTCGPCAPASVGEWHASFEGAGLFAGPDPVQAWHPTVVEFAERAEVPAVPEVQPSVMSGSHRHVVDTDERTAQLQDYLRDKYGTADVATADQKHQRQLEAALRAPQRRLDNARTEYVTPDLVNQLEGDDFAAVETPTFWCTDPLAMLTSDDPLLRAELTVDDRRAVEDLGPFAHPVLAAWARLWLARTRGVEAPPITELCEAAARYGTAGIPLMANAQAFCDLRAREFLAMAARRLSRGHTPLCRDMLEVDCAADRHDRFPWPAPVAFLEAGASGAPVPVPDEQDAVAKRLSQWLCIFRVYVPDLTAAAMWKCASQRLPAAPPPPPQPSPPPPPPDTAVRAAELVALSESDPYGLTSSEQFELEKLDPDAFNDHWCSIRGIGAAGVELVAAVGNDLRHCYPVSYNNFFARLNEGVATINTPAHIDPDWFASDPRWLEFCHRVAPGVPLATADLLNRGVYHYPRGPPLAAIQQACATYGTPEAADAACRRNTAVKRLRIEAARLDKILHVLDGVNSMAACALRRRFKRPVKMLKYAEAIMKRESLSNTVVNVQRDIAVSNVVDCWTPPHPREAEAALEELLAFVVEAGDALRCATRKRDAPPN